MNNMNDFSQKIWGVITGDIIGFSNLDISIRRRMPQVMLEAGKSLCSAFGPVMPWGVDMFRGDGWQALIADPVMVMRAALFFRAYIICATGENKVDTRMAIGIGPIDYVPPGKVSAGDGPAYRASGKMLEKMVSPRQGRIRCAFARNKNMDNKMPACMPDDELMDAVVRLAGTFGNRWQSRQAKVIIGALTGWSQARIAENWHSNISRQAVGKHLQRAEWTAIAHSLEVFEKKMICYNKIITDAPCGCSGS